MTCADATVRDVGEFGLIAALHAALPPRVSAGPGLLIGIGDDAAVWRPAAGDAVVVTTDCLVEGIHFRLDWTDWESLGHKALAVNLSDIAAMGAKPGIAALTLGLRGTERVADLVKLYAGIGALAARTGTLVAGGDIVASPTSLTIAVTALGEARGERVLTRSEARPGDLIAVSGTLGASAAGLKLLQDAPDSPRRPTATAAHMIAAHLRPEPRLALGALLLDAGATAAMDLSDGLLGDLPKVLAASGAAARVNIAHIPVAAAVRALFPDDWRDLALRGGEDYELLFTAPRAAFDAIQTEAAGIGATVTAIGEILPREPGQPILTLREPDGRVVPATGGAFDHFG